MNPLHPDDCYRYIVQIDTGQIGMVPRGVHPGIGDTVEVSWVDDSGVIQSYTGTLAQFIEVLEDE